MGFVNVMAIDRTNCESALRTTEAAAKRIKSGVSFAVFVKELRAKPGELLFKKGAFYMARQAGVPVVPVAIKLGCADGKRNWSSVERERWNGHDVSCGNVEHHN